MRDVYLDSETISFTGPPVLIQYAWGNKGKIVLHDVFDKPVKETLELIQQFSDPYTCVKAFNITFDWYQMVKTYNTFSRVSNKSEPPNQEEIFYIEGSYPQDYCLKPGYSLDFMLYCQRGPYQYLQERKKVYVRKVHNSIAQEVAAHLDKVTSLPKGMNHEWKIFPIEGTAFSDIVLRFKPKYNLETIGQDALGRGKAPSYFHLLPKFDEIKHHVWTPWIEVADTWKEFWRTNENAREYARRDVEILQELDRHFQFPSPNHYNDKLSILVANSRWKGFSVDKDAALKKINELEKVCDGFPVNLNSPPQVGDYIRKQLSPIEAATIKKLDAKAIEGLAKKGLKPAIEVVNARKANWTIGYINKLKHPSIHGARWAAHPDFMVTGTLSDRMSGVGGYNQHGAPKTIRDIYDLAYEGEVLSGGDFDGFEVTIASAVYNDPLMIEELKSGKSIHASYGASMYDLSYADMMKTKKVCYKCDGTGQNEDLGDCDVCLGRGEADLYTKAKSGFFGLIYGAQAKKEAETLGISLEKAEAGIQAFSEKYPGVGRHREKIFNKFCSMRQPTPNGKVIWHEPAEFVESLYGFKRYFTYENYITKLLFDLGENCPSSWSRYKNNIERRQGRIQTVFGAVKSALFGAAFSVQASNLRAAGNHEIQSTGATVTKLVQCRIWDHQPKGIHSWVTRPLNIHDELQNVSNGLDVTDDVQEEVESHKATIPLLSIGWAHDCKNWKESK